jgi:hypothetical protein
MLLWDYEMEALRAELQTIEPARRLVLAMTVMDWTLQSMGRIETEEVRTYIEEGMRLGHEAVLAGGERILLPDDMLEAYQEVDESADESGTSHMLSALLACSDAPEGLTGEVLYGVLSFCYEGLLDREEIPIWSVEAERGNAKCVEVIAFQKSRIAEALGRS